MSKIPSAYAGALWELAKEEKDLLEIGRHLQNIKQALAEAPEAKELLLFSRLDKEEKKKIFGTIVKEAPLLENFLMVLIDQDDLPSFDQIVDAYEELANDHLGILAGTVRSAIALEDSQLKTLEALFSKKVSKEVKLSLVLDESLIGGFRVTLGGIVYDNSLKTQLKHLKHELMNTQL